MENNEKIHVPIIATLKAERVNEYDFKRPTYGQEISEKYTSDFEAKVSLKVGNTIKDVTLEISRDYVSSVGEYNTPSYVESHHTPYAPTISPKAAFEDLQNAGIEIDFSDILNEYQKLVWEARDEQKLDKAKRKRERKNSRRESYFTSWPLTFIDLINKDSNKKIRAANFELKPTGFNQYVHNEKEFINIIYKNVVGHIIIKDNRYVWRNAYSVDKNENGYHNIINISDGKVRRAKREGTSLLKFLEAVDEYFVIKQTRKTRSNKEEKDRKDIAKLLQEASGEKVTIEKIRKYHNFYGRSQRNRGGYDTYKYQIKIKGKSYYVGFNSHLKTFSINTFIELSKKQFQEIIKILDR